MLLTTSKGKVDVIQKGKGKDILLLHGFLSSKETFVHQISFLSNFYKVTAIDILGLCTAKQISRTQSGCINTTLSKSSGLRAVVEC